MGRKLVANNKKARHDFFIEDEYEAGIVLTGTEIKSVRNGRVNLKESFIKIEEGEAFIYGMHISPYEQGNIFNVDPLRVRKLLLNRREITKLKAKTQEEGLAIVPLNMYINDAGRAKLEIASAKGKKLHDKRNTIAKRDADMKMRRAMLK